MGENAIDQMKDWAKGEIQQAEDALNSQMSQLSDLNNKIERLQAAQRGLQAAMDELSSFKSQLNSIHSSLSSSQFKGTRRSKLDNQFQTLIEGVDGDKNLHQLNLNELGLKIGELQIEQAAMSVAISGTNGILGDLYNMLS